MFMVKIVNMFMVKIVVVKKIYTRMYTIYELKIYSLVKMLLYKFPIILILFSILYFGNNMECPICGGHFRKFVSFHKRQNVLCPRCCSFHRHRLLWMFLNNETNIFSDNLKVLHIAPEIIFQKIFERMSNLNYISADLTSPLARITTDITNISFKDNSFDVILCIHVLEHILKDQDAMKELFRVLKPGGWAILQSPVDIRREKTLEHTILPKDREHIFGHSDHVRLYGNDYKDRLENAGFVVKVNNYVKELGVNLVGRYGLLNENIYYCIKQ